jgi:hypothetical protein
MKKYYKLARKEEIVPTLETKLLEDTKWERRLKEKLPSRKFYFTEGLGEQTKSVPLNELPPAFLMTVSPFSVYNIYNIITAAMGLNDPPLLVCNLNKMNPHTKERILQAFDALEWSHDKHQQDLDQLLETFAKESFVDKNDSVLLVSPQYVSKNFPLTYSEEMIYDCVFAQHPLVGYEQMLVPLEMVL